MKKQLWKRCVALIAALTVFASAAPICSVYADGTPATIEVTAPEGESFPIPTLADMEKSGPTKVQMTAKDENGNVLTG